MESPIKPKLFIERDKDKKAKYKFFVFIECQVINTPHKFTIVGEACSESIEQMFSSLAEKFNQTREEKLKEDQGGTE